MFFKKKTCSKCNHEYDPLAESCPYCGNENNDNKEYRNKTKICWIPLYYQILVFIIGFIVFTIISYCFSLIFANLAKTDEVQALMWINVCSYIICFAGAGFAVFHFLKVLFKDYNKSFTWILGIVGGVALILVSMLLTYIAGLIHPGEGGNQSAAIAIVKRYPAVGILILGILGPILEELTYRVGLFSFMARTKRWIAYIVCGIVFGLIHFDFKASDLILELVLLPQYIVAGLLLSHVYDRGGFISSCVAHIINNLFAVIQILIFVK